MNRRIRRLFTHDFWIDAPDRSSRRLTMTCADSLEFLYHLQKHGIKLGLDTVESLLDRIGDPDRRYPTLHIGGTNGKGSAAALDGLDPSRTARLSPPWACTPRHIS